MTKSEIWLEKQKSQLPPHEWSLLFRAVKTLEDNTLTSPRNDLPWYPRRGIIPSPFRGPGGIYRGIWNWDAAFHATAVVRWDAELAREQIRILLDRQLPSGALVDVIYDDNRIVDNYGKPPLLPWAAALVDKWDADDSFLRDAYEGFTKYEAFWRRERGGDENGLFHYDTLEINEPRRFLEIKYESGWDNSSRWDEGIHELWPIDLNGYMVMTYQALMTMAARLGLSADVEKWRKYGRRTADLIEERLFDQDCGAYLDYNRCTKRFSTVLSPASFMPLYLRIASKERASRMADIAANPQKFFPGFPTVAYDDPTYSSHDYWRGPMWLNVAYFALKGLQFYGFGSTADSVRRQILDWCMQNEEYIYEHYDSRTGKGVGAKQFSWSAVFIIQFLLNWRDEHGNTAKDLELEWLNGGRAGDLIKPF